MSNTHICERCGDENPADAQFCIDCGAALPGASLGATTRLPSVACPACRTPNPAGAQFCVACGRGMAVQPAQRPIRPPAAPHAPMLPRQSFPRVDAPPVLQAPRPAHRPASPAQQGIGPLVFLAGLAFLLIKGLIWPGILLLIGVTILVSEVTRGRIDKGLSGLFWLGGLAWLFSTGKFWPGILVLIIANAVLSSVLGRRGTC